MRPHPMKGFISELAERLYDRYGDEVSSLRMVFPSRRARLFFSDALASVARRPLREFGGNHGAGGRDVLER